MLFMQFIANYLFIFNLTDSAHSTIRNVSFIFQISIGKTCLAKKINVDIKINVLNSLENITSITQRIMNMQ